MSSKSLGIVVGIGAMFIPIIGPILAPALMSAAAWAAVSAGVAIAGSLLLGPKMPSGAQQAVSTATDRLNANLDVTAPRKIVLGTTAFATDIRYAAYVGDDHYWQVIALASHEVTAIKELWIENDKAWDSVNGIASKFTSYLTVTTRTLGTAANGVAIDSRWTSNARLTGCAYLVIQYRITGLDSSVQSPFAGGISPRLTIRGEGARYYDPRLDSTVTGGSGAHRADDQATWTFNATTASNPALQLLWYMLGWKISGKLAVGMGLPKARIDLASFITAANACEESVTKGVGGTEQRYRTDGVFSEGDERQAVLEALCTPMNAQLRDSSGKIAIKVIVNDLATPVASFDDNDILGEEKWSPTPSIDQSRNRIRGRFVDASDRGLYQLVDYPEVGYAPADGIERVEPFDLPLVASASQAQRLAKQRLQRSQYQGTYSLLGGPRWWQTSLGDVVQMSHQGLGWANKLFRVAGQSIDRSGATRMTLLEENAAVYAWDNSDVAPVSSALPTTYDPTNSPILRGVLEAGAQIGYGPAYAYAIHDYLGAVQAGQLPPRNILYKLYIANVEQTAGVTWTYLVLSGTVNGFTSADGSQSMTGTGTGTFAWSSIGSSEAKVQISADKGIAGAKWTLTLSKVLTDAPASGGGGGGGSSASQNSGFAVVNSSTFAAITNQFDITAASTSVNVNVQLSFEPDSASPGSGSVEVKVQKLVSAVWTDVGSVRSDGWNVSVDLEVQNTSDFSFSQGDTVTSGSAQSYRVVARNLVGSRTQSPTGSVLVTS